MTADKQYSGIFRGSCSELGRKTTRFGIKIHFIHSLVESNGKTSASPAFYYIQTIKKVVFKIRDGGLADVVTIYNRWSGRKGNWVKIIRRTQESTNGYLETCTEPKKMCSYTLIVIKIEIVHFVPVIWRRTWKENAWWAHWKELLEEKLVIVLLTTSIYAR